MNCPACGALNQDRREECSACGIIFARWRPRDRKAPSVAPPPHRHPPVDYWVVVPVVMMAILIALVTLSVRRPARANHEAGTSTAPEVAQSEAPSAPAAPAPIVIPEQEIFRLIEECDYFQEPITIRIPKSVYTNLMGLTANRYPALLTAAHMGLVEFDPSFDASYAARHLPNPANPGRAVAVKLGPNAHASLRLSETADEYHFDLGRRRVERLSSTQRIGERLSVGYYWTVEASNLLTLAPDSRELWGGADLQQSESGWRAVRVWRNTSSAARILCSTRGP